MTQPARCLVLACGNTLRSDDGVGPFLACWAEERFASDPRVSVISRIQWTPELAQDLSQVDTALFLDCSAESAPGQVLLFPVVPTAQKPQFGTHHVGAPELLALARDLFCSLPRQAQILTIGGDSFEVGEQFSPAIERALPEAKRLLENAISAALQETS
jgi:hydrogenase maturation protease